MPASISKRTVVSNGERVVGILAAVMVAAALLTSIRAHAEQAPADCKTLTRVEVMQLLNLWKTGLVKSNPARVAAFYAEDATLLPAKDAAPLKGKKAIQAYYDGFLPRHPQPKIISSNIAASCNTAKVDGIIFYRVTGERKGTRSLLGGRYAIEFAFRNNVWVIVNQALAANPRKLGEPVASAEPL